MISILFQAGRKDPACSGEQAARQLRAHSNVTAAARSGCIFDESFRMSNTLITPNLSELCCGDLRRQIALRHAKHLEADKVFAYGRRTQ